MNYSETNYRKIGIVAAIAIAIAAMMIPGASLASTALADKGGKVSDSGNVQQSISQSNSVSSSNSGSGGSASADHNTQTNNAANIASVDIHNGGGHDKKSGHHHKGGSIKGSGNVVQSIDQSNSISASNSGSGGSASADHNTQTNNAANIASVDIHNHGGKIKDSGNVLQAISQSNSITATNTAPGGSATADDNSQSNDAANVASVDIHNGGYHGGKIKDSGNVLQAIAQDNSITATNSPPPLTADSFLSVLPSSATADDNTQSNTALNIASVDIHNHGGTIKDSGNVAQLIAQANSINATNTGNGGSASASDNSQSNNATNFADISISNH
ncbi:MAG TPA: hypothetical protein VFI73_09600 [Candidatus Nitrosopolaris sp.]|nr:hypothetical protein [Candidatus Nitrosopolaris sp.]